jgi:hypothetical protein
MCVTQALVGVLEVGWGKGGAEPAEIIHLLWKWDVNHHLGMGFFVYKASHIIT